MRQDRQKRVQAIRTTYQSPHIYCKIIYLKCEKEETAIANKIFSFVLSAVLSAKFLTGFAKEIINAEQLSEHAESVS